MSMYQIADEPRPGALARFAVNPLFPFLSIMLGGLWIAFPWFALNGVAVGSPTLRRELAWLAFGLLVICLLPAILLSLANSGALTGIGLSFAALSISVAKLAVVYAVFMHQARTIELYQYYGGVLRNGIFVIIAMLVLQPSRLLEQLPVYFQLVLR